MKPQTQSILKLLESGRTLTPAQARTELGVKSLGARIHELRSEGYPVYSNYTKSGVTYRLGVPSRDMVAAAFNVLGKYAFE